MTLFDPKTGQFVTIDLSPSAHETEASLGERASRGRTAQPDRRGRAGKEGCRVVPSTSEQTSSPSSDGAAVLAVLGALGALYLPLLWV